MFPFSILIYKFINTRVNPDVILQDISMNPLVYSQREKTVSQWSYFH